MASDILAKIIQRKEEEIERARGLVSETELRRAAETRDAPRPFFDSLRKPGVNIVAEIKRASPSKGPIRIDLDPASLARCYESGGAAALSVLTDREFFKGSPEDCRVARASVSLPVLRKDFVVCEYQVYETAAMGADAVLLIARCLSDRRLADLHALCRDLGLCALVEVFTERDLESAARAGAKLIGVNNRNLRTFETDLDVSRRMVSLMGKDQVPVAASGIRNRQDVRESLRFGLNNFLIGESLVRSDDPEALLEDLRGVSETQAGGN